MEDSLTTKNSNESTQENSEEIVISEETADDQENKTPDNSDGVVDKKRSFKYPLTISNDFPAKIIFKVFEINDDSIFEKSGIAVEKVWDQLKSGLTEGFDDTVDTVGTFVNKGLSYVYGLESVGNEYVTPKEAKRTLDDAETTQPQIQTYENKGVGTQIGSVTLPLQRPLRYSDVAQYEGASLGIIGGMMNDVLSGNNPFEGISSNGKLKSTAGALAAQVVARGLGTVAGATIGSKGGIGGAILGGIAGSNTGEQLGGATKNATRISSAPNFRTLFNHVDIRNFSFDFKMIATSKEESVAINNIIKLFRQELYPEKIPLGATGLPFAYKFPNVFEIEVKNRFDNTMGFKFQRCYLRNVQTVFNETATGVYDDGNFIEVSITLDFVEIVALDKQKIRDEGY